jgi:hypothetical protein
MGDHLAQTLTDDSERVIDGSIGDYLSMSAAARKQINGLGTSKERGHVRSQLLLKRQTAGANITVTIDVLARVRLQKEVR